MLSVKNSAMTPWPCARPLFLENELSFSGKRPTSELSQILLFVSLLQKITAKRKLMGFTYTYATHWFAKFTSLALNHAMIFMHCFHLNPCTHYIQESQKRRRTVQSRESKIRLRKVSPFFGEEWDNCSLLLERKF